MPEAVLSVQSVGILPRMSAATDARMPAIRMEGVRKTFGDVQAVRGLDLEIADGEFFAMLGPSSWARPRC